jgi:hypothetical protein
MSRYGFAYACVGRSLSTPVFTGDASLERLMSLAKARADAPSLEEPVVQGGAENSSVLPAREMVFPSNRECWQDPNTVTTRV